jgi:hypothetical protein
MQVVQRCVNLSMPSLRRREVLAKRRENLTGFGR